MDSGGINMTSQYVVVDTFAGAGGLAEGFFLNGFNILSHIEMNHYAAKTLQTRTLYHALNQMGRNDIYYNYYNQKTTREEFFEEVRSLGINDSSVLNCELSDKNDDIIIAKVSQQLAEAGRKNIDVMIGGPPCQAYSLMGRGRDPHSMVNDPRNNLYIHYLRFIREFKPEVFVFENVPGLISAKKGVIYSDFLEKIHDLGYHIRYEPCMLNAQNFGVLQNRKRIIIIGWRKENNFSDPVFETEEPLYKVWDLLSDLPELLPGDGSDGPQKYREPYINKYLEISQIRGSNPFVRHHIARKHNERDREIYRIAIKKWNDEKKRLRYNEVPDHLKTHKNESSFLDRFKVVDGDGVSHAVVAHLAKDGHYFIHPDSKQIRSITVREAARIQSFPDNYLFEGSRTAQYVQIGNAVPPLMAKSIAQKIKMLLDTL
jgi:DNA (cytosine-5)-methyltransferase 1